MHKMNKPRTKIAQAVSAQKLHNKCKKVTRIA